MIAHPTHILIGTRCGSRRAGAWLNQPGARRKGEPNRRRAVVHDGPRKGEPARNYGTPLVPVELDASPLLVILHYLLKNNTTFMEWNEQGKLSPGHPSVTNFPSGGQRI